MRVRKNRKKINITKETNNTNLVWIIALFMILFSHLWNINAYNDNSFIKSSIIDYNQLTDLKNNKEKTCSVIIDWREYEVILKLK